MTVDTHTLEKAVESAKDADTAIRALERELRGDKFSGKFSVMRTDDPKDKVNHYAQRLRITSEGDVYDGRVVYEGGKLKAKLDFKPEADATVSDALLAVVDQYMK